MKNRFLRLLTLLCAVIPVICLAVEAALSFPAISEKIPTVISFQGNTKNLIDTSPIVNSSSGQIDINSADAETLCLLDGIGPTRAQQIIEFRNAYGFFRYPEDLMLVSGIGKGIFEKNREQICCLLPSDQEPLTPNRTEY